MSPRSLHDPAIAARLSPTARHILRLLPKRDTMLDAYYAAHPEERGKPEYPRPLLKGVFATPTMDALAKEWLSHNLCGVRHLPKKTLEEILDAGNRAFNLRVADPYLRYQMPGQGFTWSFFTHKAPPGLPRPRRAGGRDLRRPRGEAGGLVEALLVVRQSSFDR